VFYEGLKEFTHEQAAVEVIDDIVQEEKQHLAELTTNMTLPHWFRHQANAIATAECCA